MNGRGNSAHRTFAIRAVTLSGMVCATFVATSCKEIASSPTTPFAIELAALSAPAVAIGDTLRDANGVATPLSAIVRNLSGDAITNAPVRYVYADASRDTALFVDSITGIVVALKPLSNGSTTATGTPLARIAARVGNNLQVVRTIRVTTRPDSVDRNGAVAVDSIRVALPDNTAGNDRNTSSGLAVAVRHVETAAVTGVQYWLVKYEISGPANSINDSTRGAYLVDETGKVSNVDTTDASGLAARYVRVRPSQFPPAGTVDSVIVLATVRYRGENVKGSPIRIKVPVKKP